MLFRKERKKKDLPEVPSEEQEPEIEEEINQERVLKKSLSPDNLEETSNTNILSFIQENAEGLAAIGLIGTMIALMPSFVEKLSDDVWLGTFSSIQISFFTFR